MSKATHIKPHRAASCCLPLGIERWQQKSCQLKLLLIEIMNRRATKGFQWEGGGVATIVPLRLAANWIALKMLQRRPKNVAPQQQIQEVLKAERGVEGDRQKYSSRCCALCAGAALLPAQNAYNKFHTFLLRLPVSPPLTGKCAQLQGSHDLLVCCKGSRGAPCDLFALYT